MKYRSYQNPRTKPPSSCIESSLCAYQWNEPAVALQLLMLPAVCDPMTFSVSFVALWPSPLCTAGLCLLEPSHALSSSSWALVPTSQAQDRPKRCCTAFSALWRQETAKLSTISLMRADSSFQFSDGTLHSWGKLWDMHISADLQISWSQKLSKRLYATAPIDLWQEMDFQCLPFNMVVELTFSWHPRHLLNQMRVFNENDHMFKCDKLT